MTPSQEKLGRVEVRAFNPFEIRYPGRRLVSREALLLVKRFRKEGYAVSVAPYDGHQVQYFVRKGYQDILSDPLVIRISDMALAVCLSIVSRWLWELAKARSETGDQQHDSGIVIEVEGSDGSVLRFNHRGESLSEEDFAEILEKMQLRQDRYAATMVATPPDPRLPIPVFFDHSQRIVGWARIEITDRGLAVSPAEITDDRTWKMFQRGELKGFSISGIVTVSECSICKQQFSDCNHGLGPEDDGGSCLTTIKGIELCEISIVRDPVNPETTFPVRPRRRGAV